MHRLAVTLILILTMQSAVAANDVGTIDFPTSTPSREAQAHFLRGATILHSFGWKQAIESFQKAQAADPDFAMAYWGEALCYNHPLFPELDRETPQQVLSKLGATLEARLAKAPTLREKGFLRAVDVLFFGEGDIKARRGEYMNAMRELHESLPNDDEAAAFYALSLISAGGAAGKEGERERILAGSIGLRLFERNRNHPGAAHYTIHAFDDPVHAVLALPAAQQFANIAAAVSHARHMPTHIFIQLGMWQRVSDSNQSAYDAAVALFEPGDSAGDMVHALDWGQYGDLQLGDYERARLWIERMEGIDAKIKGQPRVTGALPRVRARYVLETRNWQTRPVTGASQATELLATGISAVELGNMTLAREASQALTAKAATAAGNDSFYSRQSLPLAVMAKQVESALMLANGKTDQGLELLVAATEIAERMPLPRGAANPLKPAHEMLGEALLESGDAAGAVAAFNELLLRMPNRPLSLLGLARAQLALGNGKAARESYERLAKVWKNRDFPALKEANDFLAATR